MLPRETCALARRGSGVVLDHLAANSGVECHNRASFEDTSRELHARLAYEPLHRALPGFRPLDHRRRALVHALVQVGFCFDLGHLADPLADHLRVHQRAVARDSEAERGWRELRRDGLDLHVVHLAGAFVAHLEASRDGKERLEERVGDVDGAIRRGGRHRGVHASGRGVQRPERGDGEPAGEAHRREGCLGRRGGGHGGRVWARVAHVERSALWMFVGDDQKLELVREI